MKKNNIIFVLLFPCLLFAQQSKFEFEFDYAQFAYDEGSNFIEFYYSFDQNSLLHEKTDSSVILEGILEVQISDSAIQNEIIKQEWIISHEIFDDEEKGKSLVGVVSFVLPKGIYKCVVVGKDAPNSSINRAYTEYIRVEPFIGGNISISDIQLASKIIQNNANSSSIFYKNSYEVVPIPGSIFGENQPVVFHYFELYNLNVIKHQEAVRLNTIVVNSLGNPVFNKSKMIKPSAGSRVEVGTVIVHKLPTDTYTLIIALIDSIGNYGVTSSKRFYVYNPSIAVEQTTPEGLSGAFLSHFGVMSEEETDDLFEKSRYIATVSELDQYKKLTSIEGKREFLYQFWKLRNPNPLDDRNTHYLNYLSRIEASNQQFSTLGRTGWKTDRGRVLITYGEPNDIERFPSQTDVRPYEIWHYHDIEGGVIFVFADLTGLDYTLLHSTLRGEIRDDAWVRRIYVR